MRLFTEYQIQLLPPSESFNDLLLRNLAPDEAASVGAPLPTSASVDNAPRRERNIALVRFHPSGPFDL
jgi:hypothetical protein